MKPEPRQVGISHYPTIPMSEAQAIYRKKVAPNGGAESSNVELFLRVMSFCAEFKSFTVEDVLRVSKAYLLDRQQVITFFDKWVATMRSLQKLEEEFGVYDTPIYKVIN